MLTQLPVLCLSFLVIYPEELGHLSGKSFSKRIIVLSDWLYSTSHNKIPSPGSLLSDAGSINSKSVGLFGEEKSPLNFWIFLFTPAFPGRRCSFPHPPIPHTKVEKQREAVVQSKSWGGSASAPSPCSHHCCNAERGCPHVSASCDQELSPLTHTRVVSSVATVSSSTN